MSEPQGSGEGLYRSELASATERVRMLEAELHARGGPRNRPRAARYILLGVSLSLVAMTAVGAVVVRDIRRMGRMDELTPPPAQSPAPPEPPSLHGAQWYTPARSNNQTPILMDVNADGTKDLVGLAWDSDNDEHALHVVAFDGKSHQMLWHSEGISTQWYSTQTDLRRDGETFIVTDSRNEARTIDAHTGKVLEVTLAPGRISEGPPRETHEDLRLLTPRPKVKGFYALEAHPASEMVGTVGNIEGRDEEWLIGWQKKTKAITYEVPLMRASDTRAPRSGTMRAVDAERLYSAFVSADAKQVRVVARSLTTGEVAWTADMPGTDEGAQFRALHSEEGQVFLAVDGTLLVLDAAAGRELARLASF